MLFQQRYYLAFMLVMPVQPRSLTTRFNTFLRTAAAAAAAATAAGAAAAAAAAAASSKSRLRAPTAEDVASLAHFGIDEHEARVLSLSRRRANEGWYPRSLAGFHLLLQRLVFDWDTNHVGVNARKLVAIGVVNLSRHPIVVDCALVQGGGLERLPRGRRVLLAGGAAWRVAQCAVACAYANSFGSLWGGAGVEVAVDSNAFHGRFTDTSGTVNQASVSEQHQGQRRRSGSGRRGHHGRSSKMAHAAMFSSTVAEKRVTKWYSFYSIVVSDAIVSPAVAAPAAAPAAPLRRFTVRFDGPGALGVNINVDKSRRKKPVYVKKVFDGLAKKHGVREGDLLLAVNGKPIPPGLSVDGIAKAIQRVGRPLTLEFGRR